MTITNYKDPKNSLELYELEDKLNFFVKLYEAKNFPKVLMLTGLKGIGKYTLVNHFLSYVYDKNNYDLKNNIIDDKSTFYKANKNNLFPNIIYLSGSGLKSIKVDDIRDLKLSIFKSTLSKQKRFIILDDIERFNVNSLNALLKIIEEPSLNNYFILINNKTKPLLQTIKSRALEINILIKNFQRIKIIDSLIKINNLDPAIDSSSFNLTPGNFLFFNELCKENEIDINNNFLFNLEVFLNLYKKSKDINYINAALFLTENYFQKINKDKDINLEKNIEDRIFVLKNLNKFIFLNLNQKTLLNAIDNRLANE